MTTDEEKLENLTAVLFDLVRDDIPVGRLANIVDALESTPPPYKYAYDHSKHLGDACRVLAERILGVEHWQKQPVEARPPEKKLEGRHG